MIESTGTGRPLGGLVPITSPAGRVLSTCAWGALVKRSSVNFLWATSPVWPATSGTCLVSGPAPTIRVTTLVIADVWLAGGLVPITLPNRSGVDGEFACLNLVKPAAFSLLTASE